MEFLEGFLFAAGFRVCEAIIKRLIRPPGKPQEPLEIESEDKLTPDQQFMNMLTFDGSEQK